MVRLQTVIYNFFNLFVHALRSIRKISDYLVLCITAGGNVVGTNDPELLAIGIGA